MTLRKMRSPSECGECRFWKLKTQDLLRAREVGQCMRFEKTKVSYSLVCQWYLEWILIREECLNIEYAKRHT